MSHNEGFIGMPPTIRPIVRPFVAWLLLAVTGCASIGPATVPRDRVDYITAVAEFLERADAAQYRSDALWRRTDLRRRFLGNQRLCVSGSGLGSRTDQFQPDRHDPSNLVTLGGNATYLDRPTITYTPLAGEKFAKSLLRPIPPSAIFELIQAGYRADYILQMTTRAINGVYNRSSVGGRVREAIPNSTRSWMRCDVCSCPGRSACGSRSTAPTRSGF